MHARPASTSMPLPDADDDASGEAAYCVVRPLLWLRAVGFSRLPRGSASPAVVAAHRLYCEMALGVTSLYILQASVYAYQVRGDMEALSRVLFLLLCHVTSITKQIVFRNDAARIELLVDAMRGPRLARRERWAAPLLRAASSSMRLVHRAYSGCAVLTCILWAVIPVLSFARGEPVEFPFYNGVDISRVPGFAAVLCYSYYATSLVGVANTTMDAFVAAVLLQCSTQLVILRRNVESVVERAEEEVAAGAAGGREAVAMRLLVESLKHYGDISEEVSLLQQIFGAAVLVQFTIGCGVLCMGAYKLVSLNMLSGEFLSMILFMTCIFVELFLYCYYGTELTQQSERLVDSLYGASWQQLTTRGQCGATARSTRALWHALVLSMARARRPLRPAAGRVVPLSLDTFVKIMKSSYSFYAVLRQTK